LDCPIYVKIALVLYKRNLNMGVLNDLKNIFFGASSLTKSATDKAAEFIKEEGAELLDKTKDVVSNTGETILEKGGQLKETVIDSSDDFIGQTKDKLSDFGDTLSASPAVNKMKDFTEDVGAKVMDKGGDLLEKGKDVSEDLGGKVLEAKDKIMDKAMDIKDKASDKLNETMDKADAWAAEEKANPKPEFAEDTIDASGSLLEGKDDFFSKADKFASGEYDAFSEGKMTIEDGKSIDKPKFEDQKPATGFTDLDGDGNEIIDDAQIDTDDLLELPEG